MREEELAAEIEKQRTEAEDGVLLFRYPATEQWVAIFLARQSQSWHTDDSTGYAITEPEPLPDPADPERLVRIVGALVNPIGPAPGSETVTLLNASPEPVELAGWQIADGSKNMQSLSKRSLPAAQWPFPSDRPCSWATGASSPCSTTRDRRSTGSPVTDTSSGSDRVGR